jgi:hypothetical protein
MRRTQPRDSLVYNVRSWVEEIPLGSLDQLQQVTGRSRLLRGDAVNPASIPLPVSRDSSLQDTGSEDFRREQLSEHSVLGVQDQLQLDTAEALGVPLPESSGLGNDRASEGVSTVDSLAQLQAARTSAQDQLQLDTSEALDVPLPESNGLGNGKSSSGGISIVDSLAQLQAARVSASTEQSAEQPTERPTSRPTNQTYWENIRPLTRILPHLKTIQPPNGRHQRVGRLKSIDYFNNGMAPQVGISLEMGAQFDHDQLVTALRNLKQVGDDVASRTVIVEDLCSELIGALGLAFDLDPEFFAEHLNRSGYNGADHEDFSPDRWKTAHLQKDYRSMTWMRPVYQSERMAKLLQTPEAILDTRKGSPEAPLAMANNAAVWRDAKFNDNGEPDGHAMKHTPLVDTNIFRQSWLLSGRSVPRVDFQEVEGEAQSGDASQSGPYLSSKQKEAEFLPAAWEERVSFCYHGDDTGKPIGMYHANTVLLRRSMERQLSCSRYNPGRPVASDHRFAEAATPLDGQEQHIASKLALECKADVKGRPFCQEATRDRFTNGTSTADQLASK